jgi:hypothetical protein
VRRGTKQKFCRKYLFAKFEPLRTLSQELSRKSLELTRRGTQHLTHLQEFDVLVCREYGTVCSPTTTSRLPPAVTVNWKKRKSTTAFYSHNFRLRWAKAQHGTSFTAAATLQRALVSWRRQCCELPKYALTLRVARSRGLVQ